MSSAVLYRFLTAAQVRKLYKRHITNASPTQPNLLESAVNSPMNHKHYGQDNIFQLAGILAQKIILDHPYQDGNKRTALYAADMFLKINGYQLQKRPMAKSDVELNKGLTDAHVLTATNQWTAEDLGSYYQIVAQPLDVMDKEVTEYSGQAVAY